ncbi:MAG: hypothetical protein K8E66_10295, partial [Phycisphaerales bacterium]|nr:hypothetical protein [Phycisphaerales bacterium]
MKDVPALVGSLVLTASAAAATPPIFGDWWYIMPEGWRDVDASRGWDPCAQIPRFGYETESMYLPVNQSGGGHGGPTYEDGTWMSWYAQCLASQFDRIGAPIALMIRNRNCPFPYATGGGGTSPDALPQALDALPKLDYVLMDLETWGEDGTDMMRINGAEVSRLVRSHDNLRATSAYVGNYGDWPGATDESIIFPSKRDRTTYRVRQGEESWDRDQFYRANFNLAMPNAYPYETYSRHSEERLQRGNNTPNDRAAIFWAPLERVSTAARNLPHGHRLMPWITNYVQCDGASEFYHAPPPTWEDLEALVQHFRFRGASSYMLWTPTQGGTDHPTIDYQSFRLLAMDSWG